MATVTSRQGLVDYCLRRLGDPVIEINVDEDQIEDKVDDALQLYQEFHGEGTYRSYLSHLVTATDVTNGYIPISSNVTYLTHLFPINSTATSSGNFFDFQYQLRLNDFQNLASFSGNLAYFDQMKQYLSLIDMKLNGTPQTTYVRKANRLYLWGDMGEGDDVQEGDYLMAEVYVIVDPESHASVYNDIFIKDYTTSLIKQQWGQNMSKFEGMQLPGGVTISGRQMLEEATQELETLRERMRLEHERPIDFYVG
jgi:hypothetical protein